MKKALSELGANLRAGLKLISLRECRIEDFHVSLDQAVLLLILDLALDILSDYLPVLPDPEFNSYGFPVYGFSLLCFFFASYLIGKIISNRIAVLQLVVILYSAAPASYVFSMLISWLSENPTNTERGLLYGFFAAYYFLLAVLLIRPVRIVALPMKRFAALGLTVFSIVWIAPSSYFESEQKFWYRDTPDTEEDEPDPYANYRDFDAEALMFNQHQILQKALNALKPGKPGINDLYFVSFASYAYQDVFLKEANFTQQLLDKRFGTKGRSIRLINHLETRDEIPLATATNLAATLIYIARIMNPDEDILVLYLTTHGSKDHRLSVSFWPLALNDIDPASLRTMFDEAGIQWRVIIISACYSGGFIDELKDSRTLVATAAAADKTSFGCSNGNDFTYFGEAVFKDQLSREFSFLEAFQQAALNLEKRERAENLTPSNPQLYVGESIKTKLDILTGELTSRYCRAPDLEPSIPVCG